LRVDLDKAVKKISISLQRRTEIKDALLTDRSMVAFSLVLFFVVQTVVLTVWGYGYKWAFYVSDSDLTNLNILREALIITPPLHDRYLIPLRLLISYPIAYPLAAVARKVGKSIRGKQS
jgi:hypothetical protein